MTCRKKRNKMNWNNERIALDINKNTTSAHNKIGDTNSNHNDVDTSKMVESISQMSISSQSQCLLSSQCLLFESNNSNIASSWSSSCGAVNANANANVNVNESVTGNNEMKLNVTSISNTNTNTNASDLSITSSSININNVPCSKRARMLEGIRAMPLMVHNGNNGDNDNDNQCEEELIISPPESPLTAATGCAINDNEGLRSVFRRIGNDEEDADINIRNVSNAMSNFSNTTVPFSGLQQRTTTSTTCAPLRRKNTGLSISTSLDWQSTQDNLPIAPKHRNMHSHRRPFKSFWTGNYFLSSSHSPPSPITNTNANVIQYESSDSFSIGCNSNANKSSSSTSKNNNKHNSMNKNICRRLRKVMQIQNNNNNNLHSITATNLNQFVDNVNPASSLDNNAHFSIPKILTSSTTDSTIINNNSNNNNNTISICTSPINNHHHKRKASNTTRLSKFRIRNSEHFASL